MTTKSKTRHTWTTQHSEYEKGAISVLQRSPHPLTINELVTAMVSEGLVTVRGKTPIKTLYALIARKEKRRLEIGAHPLFEKISDSGSIKYRLFSKSKNS